MHGKLKQSNLITMHEAESEQHVHLNEQKRSYSPSDDSEYEQNKANSEDKNAGSRTGKCTKSLSLELTSEMHKTLKRLALQQDDTLNSLVIEAIKQFIKNDELLSLKQEALRKRLSR